MNTALDIEAVREGRSTRLRRLQYVFTGFCAMSIAVNFLDRATISVAALPIRHDFGLTATEVGGLISVWSISYSLGQLPAGFLVDRFGPRLLAGLGMLLWSICQGAGGLTRSFTQLFWLRSALGVAEAPTGPSNARVVATWFPPHERGVPTGVYVCGTAIGPAIAPPVLTALMLALGWRAMFVTMGLVGVVASMCWFLLYREPSAAGLSVAERDRVLAHRPDDAARIGPRTWGRLFRSPTVLGIIFGSFAQGFVVWIYGGWLPAFLETQYHESMQRTGVLAALPWIGGIIGALSGGYISDLLIRRGHGPVSSRKLPIVAGLAGLALFTGFAGLSGSAPAAIAFIFLALLCGAVTTAAMWAAATILVPSGYVASLGAIINFAAFLGATCSPVLTGFIVDATGSFDLALLIGAAVGLIGAMFFAAMIRAPVTAAEIEGR